MLELIVEAAEGFIRLRSGTGLMAQSPFSSCRQQHQYHLPLTCFCPDAGAAGAAHPDAEPSMGDSLPDAALLHQCLYLVESFPWNDGRMCSYCVILFMLTGVFVAGRRKCIAGVGFLPQGISCVFFVGEDVSDRGTVPFFSLAAGNAPPRSTFLRLQFY